MELDLNDMQDLLRIKFIGKDPVETWIRQFPGLVPRWGNCEFIFDPKSETYDWLVVYNDLPDDVPREKLKCPRRNTLLVTSEPPSIKCYGRRFTGQFGFVLTSQPEWALPHSQRIYSQPALQWFYGRNPRRCISYDEMANEPPLSKDRTISTVCSSKRQRHTLHNKRFDFIQSIKRSIPELDIFGHGVRPIEDKAQALDGYKYHIAIENYQGLHHWTEKLSDPFLGCALPFYSGCPNASDYFPQESFIPIDINEPEKTIKIIQEAMYNDEYEKRLPYIMEARRLVMKKYNIFSVISNLVQKENNIIELTDSKSNILSRKYLRKKNPIMAVEIFFEKVGLRISHRFRN